MVWTFSQKTTLTGFIPAEEAAILKLVHCNTSFSQIAKLRRVRR